MRNSIRRIGQRATVACVLAVLLALVGCGAAQEAKDDASSQEAPTEEVKKEEPAKADNDSADATSNGESKEEVESRLSQLDLKFGEPSNLKKLYSFSVEGKSYTLPCSMQEFLKNGWSLDPTEEFSGHYYKRPDNLPKEGEHASFSIFYGKKLLTVNAIANGATSFEDCTVSGIDPKYLNWEEDIDVEVTIAGSITRESKLDDVLALYGAPQSVDVSKIDHGYAVTELIYTAAGYKQNLKDNEEQAKREADAAEEGRLAFDTRPIFHVIQEDWDYACFKFDDEDGKITSIHLVNPGV